MADDPLKSNDWYASIIRESREPLRPVSRGIGRTNVREEEEEDLGFFDTIGDYLAAPFRGAEGAVQGIYGLADTIFADLLPDYDEKFLGESKTGVGGFIQGVSQFAAGFIPIGGWLSRGGNIARLGKQAAPKFLTKAGIETAEAAAKAATAAGAGAKGAARVAGAKAIGGRLAHGAVAGSLTDFLVFDGHEARLSNLIQSVPELANPVTEFLAASDEDSEIVGRLKTAIEGVGLGLMFDSLFLSLKRFRAEKKVKDGGGSPAEVEKAGDDAVSVDELREAYDDKGSTRSQREAMEESMEGVEPPTRALDIEDDVRLGGATIHPVTDFPGTAEWNIADRNTRMPVGPDPDHLYHVTTRERAQKIIDEGELRPGETQSMDEGFYSGYSKDKVFLTEKDGVSFWSMRVEEHLSSRFDEPDAGWDLVVLKIKRSDAPDLKIDAEGTRDAKGGKSYYSGRPIELSPDDVRLGDDTAPRTDGEPGALRDVSEAEDVLSELPDDKGGWTKAQDRDLTDPISTAPRKRGVQSIINRLNQEVSLKRMDQESADFGIDLIQRLSQQADLSGLALSIRKMGAAGTLGGVRGEYDPFREIISISRRAVQEGDIDHTFTHEIWHALTKYVDPSDLKSMRRDLEKARHAYAKKHGVKYEDLFEGKHLEAKINFFEHARTNKVEKAEYYRLTNQDEWLSENMADATLSRMDLEDGTKTIVGFMRYMMKNVLTSIKSVFGRGTYDKLARGFLDGTYVQKTRGGGADGGKLIPGMTDSAGMIARDIDPSKVDDDLANMPLNKLKEEAGKHPGIEIPKKGSAKNNVLKKQLIDSIQNARNAAAESATPQAAGDAAVRSVDDAAWSTARGTPTERAAAFDALDGDAEVTLFHATSDENAENILKGGDAEAVPQGRGIAALDEGLYVGTDPVSVEGMGPRILAVTVKKSQVTASSEYLSVNPQGTPGGAVVQGAGTGGVIKDTPLRVEDVTKAGRYNTAAESLTTAGDAAVRSVDDAAAAAPTPEPKLRTLDEDAEEVIQDFGLSPETIEADAMAYVESIYAQTAKTLGEGVDPHTNPRDMTPDEMVEHYVNSKSLNMTKWKGPRGVAALMRAVELVTAPAYEKMYKSLDSQTLEEMMARRLTALADLLTHTSEETLLRDTARGVVDDERALQAIHARIHAYEMIAQKGGKEWVRKYGALMPNLEGLASEKLLTMAKELEQNAAILQGVKGLKSETGRGLNAFNLERHDFSLSEVQNRSQQAKRAEADFTVDIEAIEAKSVIEEVETRGGRDAIIKKVRQSWAAYEAQNAKGFNQIVLGTNRKRFREVLTEYWMNSILSGPLTLVTNGLSGVLTSVHGPIEAMLGSAYGSFVGKPGAREAFNDAARELVEIITAMTDGSAFKLARESWKNDEALLTKRTKFEEVDPAISAANLNMAEDSTSGMIIDWIGKGVRTPSRILTSTDEFFKQVNYRAKVKASLLREAEVQGLSGDDAAKWAAESFESIVGDGTALTYKRLWGEGLEEGRAQGKSGRALRDHADEYVHDKFDPGEGALKERFIEISQEALETAEYRTFTNQLEEGVGRSMQGLVVKHPLLRFIAPFVRTPVNLAKYAGQRTLGAPIGKFREMLNRQLPGGMDRLKGTKNKYLQDIMSDDPNRVAQAKGRLAFGMGTWVVVGHYTSEGLITGRGPSDPEQRAILEAAGWQQYSIKVGDGWLSYQRLDPFATTIGTIADMVQYGRFADDADQEGLESVFTATMVALANNFTNKSYVTGIQTFVQALSDPERHMPTMHQRYAASFIPSALGQTVGAFDDNMRDVNGVLEGMLAKLPYFGEGIPPIRNILGEPVVRRRSLGHDSIGSVMSLILPLAYREVSDDQIAGELASIGHGFTPPRSVIGNYDLRDFKSTKGQDAYDRWQELQGKVTVGGRSLRKTLGRLINSRTYQRMATEGDIGAPSPRIGEIRKVIGQYRRKAWRQLIREYPDVKAADVNLKRVRREMKRANRSVAQMVGGN